MKPYSGRYCAYNLSHFLCCCRPRKHRRDICKFALACSCHVILASCYCRQSEAQCLNHETCPTEVRLQIVNLVSSRSRVSKLEFFVALALVALAQAGKGIYRRSVHLLPVHVEFQMSASSRLQLCHCRTLFRSQRSISRGYSLLLQPLHHRVTNRALGKTIAHQLRRTIHGNSVLLQIAGSIMLEVI
jgi:hypothetical protein